MLPNTCLKMRNEVNAEKVLEFKKKTFCSYTLDKIPERNCAVLHFDHL